MKKRIKRFGTDIAGYALVLLGISLGWLPGPGGIPLILAGLGLLSIHNPWARHIMHVLKEEGSKIPELVFPPRKNIQRLHDALLICMFIAMLFLLIQQPFELWWSVVIVLIGLSLTSLSLNRSRFQKIRKKA